MCRNAIKEYRPLHTLPVYTQKNGEIQPLHMMCTQNRHCDVRYTQVLSTYTLIKSPKQRLETYCFCSVSSSSYYYY